jgi:hypothetical protein
MTQTEWNCFPMSFPHEGRSCLMARRQHGAVEVFAKAMIGGPEDIPRVVHLLERAIARQMFAKAGWADA